jgi:hypothetical protein
MPGFLVDKLIEIYAIILQIWLVSLSNHQSYACRTIANGAATACITPDSRCLDFNQDKL